jgi:hypothetical protein
MVVAITATSHTVNAAKLATRIRVHHESDALNLTARSERSTGPWSAATHAG